MIGKRAEDVPRLRYQLLHAAAGTLIAAREHDARKGLAVEVRQYSGGELRSLVPRVPEDSGMSYWPFRARRSGARSSPPDSV